MQSSMLICIFWFVLCKHEIDIAGEIFIVVGGIFAILQFTVCHIKFPTSGLVLCIEILFSYHCSHFIIIRNNSKLKNNQLIQQKVLKIVFFLLLDTLRNCLHFQFDLNSRLVKLEFSLFE